MYGYHIVMVMDRMGAMDTMNGMAAWNEEDSIRLPEPETTMGRLFVQSQLVSGDGIWHTKYA